ncbi:MAG: RNA 2',3'-cyclic phosphodiesterase, partial [Bacillota bacterium]
MKGSEGGKVRTFIAVLIDERMRRCVETYTAEVRASLEGAGHSIRWVSPAQYHFTLRFLGELNEAERRRVFDAVTSACRQASPFELRLGGLGGFPDLDRPRVLWIGVEPPGDGLLNELAGRVERALVESGFGQADRPFSPHLTIGRVQEPWARKTSTMLDSLLDRPLSGCGTTRVDSVVVMASKLTPRGPVYTPMLAVSLGA